MISSRLIHDLSVVDDRPQKKYLSRHVRGQLVAACEINLQAWKDLGIELIPDGEVVVSTIAASNKGDVTRCCALMFDKWLERDPKASWRQLIEALDIIGLDTLATQIKGRLESGMSFQKLSYQFI